jgi:cytoskeletal protein RodZ
MRSALAERDEGGFGTRLRDARERRGVSLRQIASATKISIGILEALERNDISRLPGGIFSRAFVRAYAIEVGLEPEALIQDFLAQFPHDSVTAGHPSSASAEDNLAIESDRRTASAFLWMILISVPIAGVLLYFGVEGRPAARTDSRPPRVAQPIVAPEPSAPEPAVPGSQAIASTGAVPPPAAVEQTPVPVVKPAAAAAHVDRPSVPAVADPAGHLAVSLSAIGPCRVLALVDGRRVVDRQLQSGDRRQLNVSRTLVLTVSDPSALLLTLNGEEARSLGNVGEIVTTHLTLENFRDYLVAR